MKTKKLTKDVKKPNKYLICTMDIDKSKVKSVDGVLFIEGYANTIDKDRVGDVVLPEAFTKTLPTYMDNPVLLFQHDWDKVIGTVTSAEVTDKGLYIRAKVSSAKDVEDVRTKILEGGLRTFSIGYNEVDAVFDERTKTNVIKELELLEISVVTIPANANAKFSVVESEKNENGEEEKLLAEMPEEFLTFLSESVKDLDEGEEITVEFLKELFEIWKAQKEEAGEPVEQKNKAYSQPEQDHLQKVMESACKAADACMKALQKAHGEHCKEFGSKACDDHMKAMDAYCRSMDEANRATKAYKESMTKDKDQTPEGSPIVEWCSYSRVGSADDGYAEDDKGGQGSGGARAGAGRKPGSGSRSAAERSISRQNRLAKSRERMAQFTQRSEAVKAGIKRVEADKKWTAHIQALQEARRAQRQGKAFGDFKIKLASDDALDKAEKLVAAGAELTEESFTKFAEDNGLTVDQLADAFAQLHLEAEAIAEVDAEFDEE